MSPEEREGLAELLSHHDPDHRAQGCELLKVVPSEDAATILGALERCKGLDLADLSVPGVALAAELEDCTLHRTDLTGARIHTGLRGRGNGVVLSGADLTGCTIKLAGDGIRLDGANGSHGRLLLLNGADLSAVGLTAQWCRLGRVNLPGADLQGADLTGSSAGPGIGLRQARLSGACLRGVDLPDACLIDADLRGADLTDAWLIGADLRGADLTDATLTGADLTGADLRGAVGDVSAASTDGALTGARLVPGTDLRGLSLSGADLSGLDLTGANLSGMDLSRTILSGACLRGADLSGSSLIEASLVGCDLTGADLADAVLTQADLRDAVGAAGGLDLRPGARLLLLARRGGAMPGLSLAGASIDTAALWLVDLSGADLTEAFIRTGWMRRVSLRGASLRDLKTEQLTLAGCDLRGADLRGIAPGSLTLRDCIRDSSTLQDAPLQWTGRPAPPLSPKRRQLRRVLPPLTSPPLWLKDAQHIPHWSGMLRLPGHMVPDLRHPRVRQLALLRLLRAHGFVNEALVNGVRLRPPDSRNHATEQWSVVVGAGRGQRSVLRVSLPGGMQPAEAVAALWRKHVEDGIRVDSRPLSGATTHSQIATRLLLARLP